ncbi:MAG TPA: arylamine N-acetyltransferase [Anaerolineales bacterium]|nr:arylamine N-acetyltransferase [Anaerolineales bacterium]
MQIQDYVSRLGYMGTIKVDTESLHTLHRAHIFTVPFENLDIVSLHRPIQLTEQALWNKIVLHKRGGFCYELNGMFAWLLKQIGFEVTYLNGRVFRKDGSLGIDFDHLALLIRVPGESARWLADVGFGDSFTEPLNFEERGEQLQSLRAYKLEENSGGYIVWQRNYDGSWAREYFFDLQPRTFPDDYEAGCLYHQTSPKSSFTRAGVISRATPDGRITLEENKLIFTKNGQREERPISKEEYPVLLKEHFGVEL